MVTVLLPVTLNWVLPVLQIAVVANGCVVIPTGLITVSVAAPELAEGAQLPLTTALNW